jgi:integrase/recombinase XerD
MKPSPVTQFARLVQCFFAEHLTQQKNVSPQTVLAYRDAFRLLFAYLQHRYHKAPSQLTLVDLNAHALLGFLDHLEKVRHNTVRTRNARWAAIRGFLRYALAVSVPEDLPELQKALNIPLKRCAQRMLGFLSRAEVQAILETLPTETWSGQRDRVLFQVLYNTGARVSEILEARVEHLRDDQSLQVFGKGRRQRTIPLWRSSFRMLHRWIRHANLQPGQRIFTNRWGQPLTRSGAAKRLAQAARAAVCQCGSLRDRHVSPHQFRHATAMHLLQAGVRPEIIALWLGHASPTTTHVYIEADLTLKEQALQKVQSPKTKRLRFQPNDALLHFLDRVELCGPAKVK